MYSVQLFACSPSKVFNIYPLNLYDYSSHTLQPTKYHHNKESEERHMWSKNLRQMTQSASSPLGYKGRDSYCVIGAWQWKHSHWFFLDVACNPSGLPHIHSHSDSCTSPTTPNSYTFWQEITTQLDWIYKMFVFFASLNCGFSQAMCVFFIFQPRNHLTGRWHLRGVLQEKA